MITVEQATEKAKTENPGMIAESCTDIGDQWAFYFIPASGEEATGEPYTTVDKETGTVGFLTIPPISNLLLIQKGTRIQLGKGE